MNGCTQNPGSRSDQARKIIGEHVLIVIAKAPDPKSNVLNVQDYVRNGKQNMPFFSSKGAFDESTRGASLDRPVYEIDRRLFVEMVHPEDTWVLNPGLASEMTFTGAELKQLFPEPFKTKDQGQS